MAYTVPAPELAKIVMRTCSLTLKGPGFSVNSQRLPLKKTRSVIFAAISWPRGTTAICAEMAVIVSGSVRYQKNWLRKDRRMHERAPKTHIRNVSTGRDGSSVVGTVRATCLTGEFSSCSCSSSTSDLDLASMACDDDEGTAAGS